MTTTFCRELLEITTRVAHNVKAAKFDDVVAKGHSPKERIDLIMKHPPLRQLTLCAWAMLITEKYSAADPSSEEVLISALDWFQQAFDTFRIHCEPDQFGRMYALATVQRLWKSKTILDESSGVLSHLQAVRRLYPVSDQLLSMTCDLQSWYLSHGNTLNVRMSPQSLSLVIIQLPFVKPDSIDERVLRDGMVSQKTRCEVMHTMLRFGLVLATILHDIAAGNNHGLAESDDGISANPSAISKSGDAPNSLHVEDKLGWLLVLLLEELSSNLPLTGALLGILHSLTEQVQTLDIAELAATCAQLESAMVPKFNRPGPPLAIQPELVPSLIDAVANPSHEHASKLINAQELKFAKNLVEQDVTLATLEGVWLQLDSETDRLVMPSQVGTQEQALDETLISCAPGIFELSYNCITWLGLERDASPATAAYTPALVLFFPLIKNYSLGRVVDATTLPYASHTLHTVDLKRREETAMIKAFYINIVTQDQSFRFYPIYDTEIHKVVDMISTATGLLPFKEPQYIRHTVARRLQVTRNAILDHLVERGRIGALHVPTAAGAMAGGAGSSAAAGAGGAAASSRSPWIEHSAELIRVLRKLTEEREAQALYDIERLYHSCRIEFEVTKETIHHLRLIWHNSQSETVRLKVLAIVDRILDRAVMREGDSNFIMLYRWLRHLEETVSPYKSAESLKVILVLLQRAKAIQTDPLTPLMQIHSSFNHLDEYKQYCEFLH